MLNQMVNHQVNHLVKLVQRALSLELAEETGSRQRRVAEIRWQSVPVHVSE